MTTPIDYAITGKYTWAKLLLLLLPLLVYANALDNPFHYDDSHSIVENPHIRRLANIPLFFVDPTLFSKDPENAMYRPLLLSSFAVNFAISGYEVWSYHALSLALHIVAVYFLYLVGKMLLRDRLAAVFAALIFALHPVNSESLNYISSRSEVLGGMWILIGLWAFLRYQSGVGKSGWLMAAFAAGLLSKSIVMVLPALCLGHDLFLGPRGRKREYKVYIGMGVVALGYLASVRTFLLHATIDAPVRPYSEQIWTQVKAVAFYIKLLLWPSGLNVDHQFLVSDTLFDPYAGLAFAFLSTVVFLVFSSRKRHPLLPFLLVFFLVALAPSSLIPLNVLVNEHRVYIPSAAFALALGYAAVQLASRGQIWRKTTLLMGTALLVSYGGTTIARNEIWQSDYALWRDAVDKAPLMARPYFYLAEAYYGEKNDITAAIRTYEKGMERDPSFIAGWVRLGGLCEEGNDLEAALRAYQQGLELAPDAADLWRGLARARRLQGRWQEAVEAYLRALELVAEDTALHNNLGLVYQQLARPGDALQHHLRALEIDDSDARTYVNIGSAYLMVQDFEHAKLAFGRAVEHKEDYAGAWFNLGYSCEVQGDTEGARRAYRRAAALDDVYAEKVEPRLNALRETTP